MFPHNFFKSLQLGVQEFHHITVFVIEISIAHMSDNFIFRVNYEEIPFFFRPIK